MESLLRRVMGAAFFLWVVVVGSDVSGSSPADDQVCCAGGIGVVQVQLSVRLFEGGDPPFF